MTHVVEPSRRIGRDAELVAAPRLDNQMTCYAGVPALLHAADASGTHTPLLVLFDHEESGSQSDRGAMSTLLPSVLERIVLGQRRRPRGLLAGPRAQPSSPPATWRTRSHPNYPDRHEPQHPIAVDGGPVLKVNTSLRYATDSLGAAAFALACEQAGVPMQRTWSAATCPRAARSAR